MHPDFALLEEWLNGNIQLGNSFFAESYEKVARFVAYQLSTFKKRIPAYQETVEDLTSEAFKMAIANLKKYDGTSSFYTWVCGYARNIIRNYKKRIAKESVVEDIEEVSFVNGLSGYEDPLQIICEKEKIQELQAAYESLQDDYKEILTFRIFREMSYKEIAEILGKPVDNLESLFQRALKSLRKKYFQS